MSNATLKAYYKLAKPGIVYGNVITAIAAFLFASRWIFVSTNEHLVLHFLVLFVSTVVGIVFVIGSACVFNNYLDRDIDKNMTRTKERALATGKISVRNALIYGTVLGLAGLALLFFYVNLLTTLIALFGFLMYVVVYGVAKRGSEWGAVVGSFSGAVPIVVGYTAVTSHFDAAALILFLILVFWQMPHFYAIAMYRLDEYKAAGIPVLPAQKGMKATKVHILWYMVAYLVAVSLLTAFGYAGYVYLALVLIVGARWLMLALQGFSAPNDAKWARKVFFFSLITLLAFCVTLALAPLFP